MGGRFESARMMNFVSFQRPDLRIRNFCQSNSRTVESGKLDHKVLASIVNMHDRPNVSDSQAMLGNVYSQSDAIEFSNHAYKGYAVMKRGASFPVSINHTVRTEGFWPDGVCSFPSIK